MDPASQVRHAALEYFRACSSDCMPADAEDWERVLEIVAFLVDGTLPSYAKE